MLKYNFEYKQEILKFKLEFCDQLGSLLLPLFASAVSRLLWVTLAHIS